MEISDDIKAALELSQEALLLFLKTTPFTQYSDEHLRDIHEANKHYEKGPGAMSATLARAQLKAREALTKITKVQWVAKCL